MTTPGSAPAKPFTALATLTRVETLLLLREPAAVLFTLALPLVLLLLNGSVANERTPRFGGAGTTDVLLAGYLVYVMATSAIIGLAETLADYRDRGILRRLRLTPLRPWQILTSHALTHLTMSVLGVILLVVVAAVAFGLHVPASIGAVLLGMLAAAASMISVGFALGSLLPSVRTTQAVAGAIYFPAIFVSGALFPREMLPGFAQHIGNVLPMTYAVRAIRVAWTIGTVDWPGLGILTGATAVLVLVAVRMFRWEAR
jgi:ABC-2 type transport system permease protein